MISKACQYGIRAVLYAASKSGKEEKFSISEIAAAVDAPVAFTAKILNDLSKGGIISSTKGPNGGFYVENHQLEQAVIRIVSTLDGLHIFNDCGLGLKECSELHPCPMHHNYKHARDLLRKTFENTTVAELAAGVNEGEFFLNNPLLKLPTHLR